MILDHTPAPESLDQSCLAHIRRSRWRRNHTSTSSSEEEVRESSLDDVESPQFELSRIQIPYNNQRAPSPFAGHPSTSGSDYNLLFISVPHLALSIMQASTSSGDPNSLLLDTNNPATALAHNPALSNNPSPPKKKKRRTTANPNSAPPAASTASGAKPPNVGNVTGTGPGGIKYFHPPPGKYDLGNSTEEQQQQASRHQHHASSSHHPGHSKNSSSHRDDYAANQQGFTFPPTAHQGHPNQYTKREGSGVVGGGGGGGGGREKETMNKGEGAMAGEFDGVKYYVSSNLSASSAVHLIPFQDRVEIVNFTQRFINRMAFTGGLQNPSSFNYPHLPLKKCHPSHLRSRYRSSHFLFWLLYSW